MNIKYIILIFLITSCKSDIKFKIGEPSFNVTPEYLIDMGYNRVIGVDMLIFEKRMADTIFVFEFEEFGFDTKFLSQSWEINVDAFEKDLIEEMLEPYDCSFNSAYDENKVFTIICSNGIMLLGRSRLNKENNQKKIRLTYTVPAPRH